MEITLQTLSDIELKALAYDQFAQIQLCQNNLNAINAELVRRNQLIYQNTPINPIQSIIPRFDPSKTS